MNVVEIVFGIVLLLFAVAIILVVLLQEGSQKNVGVITGGADTFLENWLEFILPFAERKLL